MEVNLEEFIAVKGITALGNQLTKEKVLEINTLDSLPYDPPKEVSPEDMDVVDEEDVSEEKNDSENRNATKASSENDNDDNDDNDGEGQTTLF